VDGVCSRSQRRAVPAHVGGMMGTGTGQHQEMHQEHPLREAWVLDGEAPTCSALRSQTLCHKGRKVL